MRKLQRNSVSERGSALIISLLVLMALTGLGAVAFTSAISGAQASRLRRSTAQASQITEGAMAAAVNALQCQSLADAIVQLATNSATRTAALEKNVDLQCRTTFVTGQDSESAFGVYSATSAGEQSGMQPAYYVTYRNPVDARHAAGSEVGKYCLKRLEVSVVGAVAPQIAEELLGSGQRALDTANDSSLGRSNAAGSMRSRMDAEVFAGPFPCSQTEK
jgi:type II secretory pathway component PulK